MCSDAMPIIAFIEAPGVIEKILSDLAADASEILGHRLLPCRAPPQPGLFD